MVEQIGFLEQFLMNLTNRVPPRPAQEREPSRQRPCHQGPGDVDCRWNLFSMYGRPVGQVIFANWVATPSAMSGKSPIHSSVLISQACLSRHLSEMMDRIAKGPEDVKKSVRAADALP
jgi:hypothetical protein